jgi:predicted kinase
MPVPTLHCLSGKLASGKTTLARRLAHSTGAVLISEDVWMSKLFPAPIVDFRDYRSRASRFRAALTPHIVQLLERGVSVVLDFGGNVPQERAGVRSLCPETASVLVHYVKASDERCKRHLHARNRELPDGAQATTDEEFDEITRYFIPPAPHEGFTIVEYDADGDGWPV